MKKLILAETAGFCHGVRRAVKIAEQAAAEARESGKPAVMLGPVIHNSHVVEKLAGQGMVCVKRLADIPSGAVVVLRSHGASRDVRRELERRGTEIRDAACVHVIHIHRLVCQAEEEGRTVLIIGSRSHPEVQAIASWNSRSVVLETPDEVENWLNEAENRQDLPLTMVAQTTSTKKNWEACAKKIKKRCTNAQIFDTICGATHNRQSEARNLAAQCDAVVVIGDATSSNTRHLVELCQECCVHVYWIQKAEELPLGELREMDTVAITAGASTPGWIIKEVYDKMSEEIMEPMEIEESFAEMLEKSIKTLSTGEKATGTVVNITPTEIQVDVGTKYAGYIPVSEFSADPNAKVEELVKVGDSIEATVTRVNDAEGVITLSKKRLDANRGWEEIEQAKEDKTILEGKITEQNKGGVVANVKGVRVFIPASQTGLRRGESMDGLVGTTARLRITEVNRSRRRVVGSIRAVTAEERAAAAAQVWENIEVGKHYTGTVKSLTSYGAFVDIGGVDGMVHVTELSWSRIKTPAEVVSVGDTLDVYVIKYDPEKKKISLGAKDPNENPWETFLSTYQVGDIAKVRVVKLMSFGAFAEVVPGVDGLIHISQIADHRVEKVEDELAEGDKVFVKITGINEETRKISLSRREALREMPEEEEAYTEEETGEAEPEEAPVEE